jgi:hypothetical protein
MVSSRSVYTCARAALFLLVTSLAPIVSHAATITVPAGGDLQAALNAAKPGDTVVLAPGATYVGNFILPVHGGTTYITLTTGGDPSLLPPAGTRVTPSYAPYLAKLRSPNNLPALATKAGAAYWRVMVLELGPNDNGAGDVIALGNGSTAQNALSLVPRKLILDRLYVHGDRSFGQKRGIALNSADTTIVNSYISDIRGIGYDTQAIAGWNGPGPYRIENNYLEAATEVFLLGGDDPKIPNLVPSDVLFRGNVVTRPVSWKAPIVATPTGISATAGTGGTLRAGTYAYRVVARRPVGSTVATSARSAEFAATVVAGGKATIRWTAVSGATEYRVYGRTVGGQSMYWRTTSTSFTDTGAAGTSGTAPSSATVWQVKNLFELKNARRVQVDFNVFENHWAQAQPGPSILFTVRNQYGGCTWCVVEEVTFEHNVVRNVAAGFHILGIDPNHPSQQTNDILIRHNEVSGLDKTKWGGNGYFMVMGDNPRDITIDHNTIISPSGLGVMQVSGPPIYGVTFSNNLARHNGYGIIGGGYGPGNPSIAAYMPDMQMRRNVLAGGKPSAYPADNLFPTVLQFESMFVDYLRGDYRLKPGGIGDGMATDGKDLGADYSMLHAGEPPDQPLDVVTTALSSAVQHQQYSQKLVAAGGTSPYRWSLAAGSLPSGLTLTTAGEISGAASLAGDATFTVKVTDANNATASQPLSIHVAGAITPVTITTSAVPNGFVAKPYFASLEAAGGLGTYAWTLISGQLPAGVTLSSAGDVQGTPTTAGLYTFTAKVQDAANATRYATRSFALTVGANRPPTVSVSVPSQRVSVGAPVTLSATASDGDGVVRRVDFVVNGTTVGSDVAAPFQFTWVAKDGGPHKVIAVATDDDNASTMSASAWIQVTAEVVLYAREVKRMAGNFQLVADASAAGGQRLWNANKAAAKLSASASPVNFAEFTFYAQAGRAYHIWMRGKADGNSWANDSVYVQFSGTVDAAGTPSYGIGTTAHTWYGLEEDTSAGLSGWGWQDNGFGLGVMGTHIYFEKTGLQTIRLQQREDGLSIDQIVISPVRNLLVAPGLGKNDATIVAK